MGFRSAALIFLSCFGIALKKPRPTLPLAETADSSSSSSSSSHDPLPGLLRVRLSDGRHLAYTERGVPKDQSKFRVVIVHGFASSKEMNFSASQELLDELGIHIVLFDRAGYGESDPNPTRSLQSEASDIEELADQLQLGSEFFIIGVSIGCYPVWSCLKSIPQRLAGVALVVPMINYNWPSLPDDLTKDDYRKNLSRLAFWGARYTPGLLHWWFTQKIFASSSVFDNNPTFFCDKDMEVLKNTPGYKLFSKNKLEDRVVFDSLRRDYMVAYGKWDFDLLDLNNPFCENKSSVHIWQGHEDRVVPCKLQRYVSEKLPWIQYHEVPEGGHLLVYDSAVCEAILRSLVLGDNPALYKSY